MKPTVLLLALIIMLLPLGSARADCWVFQVAECSARIITSGGTVVSITVKRHGKLVEGGETIILDGDENDWHHVPS